MRRGIVGDVEGSGGLVGGGEAMHGSESPVICFDGGVDGVAVKGQDEVGACGGGGEGARVDCQVALVDGLAEGDAGEGDDLRIGGSIHEDDGVGMGGEVGAQDGRYLAVDGSAGVDIFCALHVDQGTFAEHAVGVEGDGGEEDGGDEVKRSGLVCARAEKIESEVGGKAEAEREGGKQFHAVAEVVPGVRPPDGHEDGN